MAAGALVDRADVQAGRAADAVQRLPADLVGQRRGAAVVEQDQVELLRSVAGGTPVHIEVYGFIRSPVDDRGSSCRNTSRSCQAGTHLLDAHDGDQRLGQGQAHPAVALGLDDARGFRSRRWRSSRRRCRPWRAGTSAAGAAGPPRRARPGSSVRPGVDVAPSRAGRCRGSRRGCGGSRAPGCARAGRAQLHDQLGEIGLVGVDPGVGQGLVQPDLLGGHRLDLDHLGRAGRPRPGR